MNYNTKLFIAAIVLAIIAIVSFSFANNESKVKDACMKHFARNVCEEYNGTVNWYNSEYFSCDIKFDRSYGYNRQFYYNKEEIKFCKNVAVVGEINENE